MVNTIWTEKFIPSRLGASTTAVLSEKLGARHIARWRELGIHKMEVCGYQNPGEYSHYDYRDKKQVSELVLEARRQEVDIVAVHAPRVAFYSEVEEERREAVQEATKAAEAALELGASYYTCHFGVTCASEKSVREMLERFEGTPLHLLVENGRRLSEYIDLVDTIKSEQFGMNVDVGHTRDPDGINPFLKEGVAYDILASCETRLKHLHLHDWKAGKDHIPPLEGEVQWAEIFRALQDISYQGALMFEVSHIYDNVLEKIAEFPAKILKYLDT